AVAGLASARPAWGRSALAEVAGRNLLADYYNANPASMAAAIDALADLRGDRAGVAVIGDMLELGDAAASAHRDAGRRAAGRGLAVIALGEHAGDVAGGAR